VLRWMVTIAIMLTWHLVGVVPDQSAIDDNLLGVKGTNPSCEVRNRRVISGFVSSTTWLWLRFSPHRKFCGDNH